jgi:glycosyltransferase involved in cell wall biosynthesis
MKNAPLISVIMPVHNGASFLAGAIDTIQHQSYRPIEIIVVDDGSTDQTAEIAARFQDDIRYVYQANQGPAAARNAGIQLAQGEIITFLDVDDLWADGALLNFTAYLMSHPNVEIVQGLVQRMQLVETGDQPSPTFTPIFQPYQFVNLGSALYRRAVFDNVGLFDELLWDNEDTDWFIRAWELNIPKIVLPRVMLFYRKHDRNMTLQQKDLIHFGLMKIYKRRIDRARARNERGEPPLEPSTQWSDYLGQAPD